VKHVNRFDQIRIASPCQISWQSMSGDERVRSCDLCNLQVYNIASLTRREAEELINNAEGRVCARIFRRADGTIITRDCPVGLSAVRRRGARIAGAVFAAIMSLAGSVLGQKQSGDKSSCTPQVTITRTIPDLLSDAGAITGTVYDVNGAVIPGVKIKVLRSEHTTVTNSKTDDQGSFRIRGLSAGTYEITFEAAGFTALKAVEVKLNQQDSVTLSATLIVRSADVLIGVVGYDSSPVTSPGTIILNSDFLRRLPIRE
jgi:hypothetical protein